MRRVVAIGLVLASFCATAPLAPADAIDGDWCSAKGENLKIDGTKIRTPSGTNLEGLYTRHQFAYESPKGDADEGFVVHMQQQNEETMVLRRLRAGEIASTDVWHRCSVTSSRDCQRRIYSVDPLCHTTHGRTG